jgi:hypothetical protein
VPQRAPTRALSLRSRLRSSRDRAAPRSPETTSNALAALVIAAGRSSRRMLRPVSRALGHCGRAVIAAERLPTARGHRGLVNDGHLAMRAAWAIGPGAAGPG